MTALIPIAVIIVSMLALCLYCLCVRSSQLSDEERKRGIE